MILPLIGAALAVSTAFALWCMKQPPLLFDYDAAHYLSLASSLARGDGYHSGYVFIHDLIQPPLYPMLVSALIRVGLAPETAGIAIVIASLCATACALILLHREIFGARGLAFTAVVAALYGNLALATHLTLEPLYCCTLAWAFWFALRASQSGRARFALGSGLFLGLGLLTRSEVVISIVVVLAFVALAPAPWRRRAILAGSIVAALAVCAVPYGLWMRARLGYFEVLPKVRYNLPLARLARHVPLPPDAADDTGTRMAQLSLMPDHATLILDHTFEHPDFDPVSLFPGASERAKVSTARALVRSTLRVVTHAIRKTAFLNPLALILIALCLWRGWRARAERLAVLALVAQLGLHLLPAIFSGEDFEERYLAAAMMWSVPLVGGGAAWLAEKQRKAVPILLAALVAVYGFGTVRLLRRQAGGPEAWARAAALDREVKQSIPRGARLLDNHTRHAWLAGGREHVIPYPRSNEEMLAYIDHYAIEYAILDTGRLRATGNPVHRELLARPSAWPPSWTLVSTVDERAPIYLVKLR